MPSSFRFLLCAALACAGFLSPGFAASRARAQDVKAVVAAIKPAIVIAASWIVVATPDPMSMVSTPGVSCVAAAAQALATSSMKTKSRPIAPSS